MSEFSPVRKPIPAGMVAARLRRGIVLPNGRIVGETDRVVHLFRLPSDSRVPDRRLTALCGGLMITPGMADMVTTITSTPCTTCLLLS